ncbi:MAG: hypothetical protein JWM68_4300, partial [Verrucomicrobiales bacterium]|nr:hypothetical protein [Verrucomicrobiales bacterium]
RNYKAYGLWLNIHNGLEWTSGDILEQDAIQLHGTKECYTASEFDILDAYGKPFKYSHPKTGTITLDRKKHKAIVAVYVDGKPLDINGRYRYKDKRN